MNLPAIFNPYERKARLYPALLAILPVVGSAILAFHEALSTLQTIASVLLGAGGAFLCAELARDGGKRIEPKLMEKWGGLPSATIFRHSDPRLDPVTKARYHGKLAALVTAAPTSEREAADPKAADAVYLAWSNYVRTHTRDQKKYSLLFQENVSYGFRRNVLGLRIFALTLSALCFLAALAVLYLKAEHNFSHLAAVALNAGFLAFWSFVVDADWVKIPALGYAQQLAEAVDTLSIDREEKPPAKKAATRKKECREK